MAHGTNAVDQAPEISAVKDELASHPWFRYPGNVLAGRAAMISEVLHFAEEIWPAAEVDDAWHSDCYEVPAPVRPSRPVPDAGWG